VKHKLNKSNKILLSAGLSAALLLPVTGAYSSVIEASTMKSGVTFCGGNHFTRAGGTERSFTVYQMRNYSGNKTIKIDSVRVYDGQGSTLYNFPGANPFPGSFKTIIGPRAASTLNTASFMSANPQHPRPITIQINWTYKDGQRGIPLFTGVVRHFKSTSNNASRASFSAASNCFVRAN